MTSDRSPTGSSEARAWVSELMKRLPWRWIVGTLVVLAILWLIGWGITEGASLIDRHPR